MKYMLDTNICIYTMKNKPAIVSKRVNEHSRAEGLSISVITLAELENWNTVIKKASTKKKILIT